jgi:hypothetical protein
MGRHVSIRRFRAAILVAFSLVLVVPGLAAAHAELVRSSPADGDTVEGTPAVITADFSEPVSDGSTIDLVDASGAVVAEGRIHEFNDTRLIIEPDDLSAGEYEVRWQAIADDGHIERGTFSFTVVAPPTPTPSPTPAVTAPPESAAPSPPPTATVAPAPTPSPTPAGSGDPASSADTLLPILAAVILVAVLGGFLLLRRRPSS